MADTEQELQSWLQTKLEEFRTQSQMQVSITKHKMRKCPKFKCPGIYFTKDLCFCEHVGYTLNWESCIHFLEICLQICLFENVRISNPQLLNDLVRPIILNGAAVWFPWLCQSDIDKIGTFFRGKKQTRLGFQFTNFHYIGQDSCIQGPKLF